MNVENQYVKLNVEKYGGMLCGPWFDRPLSVAGRVIVQDGNKLETKLVDVDRDILMLPSLAVHMNRDVNDGYKYNFQKDMLPLFRMNGSKTDFLSMIAAEAGVEKENIKGSDLFLYDRMEAVSYTHLLIPLVVKILLQHHVDDLIDPIRQLVFAFGAVSYTHLKEIPGGFQGDRPGHPSGQGRDPGGQK